MKHLSKYTRQKLKKMYAGGDTVEQIASKTGLKVWQVTIAVLNKKIITKSN